MKQVGQSTSIRADATPGLVHLLQIWPIDLIPEYALFRWVIQVVHSDAALPVDFGERGTLQRRLRRVDSTRKDTNRINGNSSKLCQLIRDY